MLNHEQSEIHSFTHCHPEFDFSTPSFGQFYSLGVKAGPDFSYITNNPSDENFETVPLVGIQGGLVNNFKVSRLFSVQVEALFIQKGFKVKALNIYDQGNEIWLRMNYLSLPVLARFTFPAGSFTFSGLAGGFCAYALNGRYTVKYNQEEPDKSDVEFGNIRHFDAGVCAGAGVGFRVGPGDLFIDFRFDYGLTVYNDWRYLGSGDHAFYSYCLGLGYLFHSGMKN